MKLSELIAEMEKMKGRIQKKEDPDVWVSVRGQENLVKKVRYYPGTEKEYAGIIIQ